ncbi:AzlD domain-containing protein [Glutamicibacter sp. FBE19]|nr:AzlD domain-containing protein [Glutamicibacter sp. FBE19]
MEEAQCLKRPICFPRATAPQFYSSVSERLHASGNYGDPVFYTIRDTPLVVNSTSVAVLAGLMVTAALHLWRKNATLSVLAGTAAHVITASTLSF